MKSETELIEELADALMAVTGGNGDLCALPARNSFEKATMRQAKAALKSARKWQKENAERLEPHPQ